MEVSILQRRAAEGDPATEAAPPVQERVQERTPEPPADEVPAEPAAAEQAAPVRPASPPSGVGIEQWLTSRGLVWLGGVTLALAGLFLAKYTYDHGWLALGPGARCAAGFLFGMTLAAAGEWLRRRPLPRALAATGPNYLPPAPTDAGVASAFGSLSASCVFVVLGGVTLGLAGLFLAKYTYDHGWLALGPGARCAAGFLFGMTLAAAGEWLRRRPLQRAIAAIGPNYLPPALTAAGVASAFGSLYAAYGLYGLLPPLAAFLLLALVAFTAFALALLHGPFLAVLALLGGFVTPLLVESPAPSVWGLFAYLLALSAAALAVTRAVGAWWLAWGTLLGAALWPLLWFAALWSPGDIPALGGYLVLLTLSFLAVRERSAARDAAMKDGDLVAWAGAVATAGLGFILLREDYYGPASLVTAFALAGLYVAAAWRAAVVEGLAVLAGLFAVALVAAWHLPAIGDWPAYTHEFGGEGYGSTVSPLEIGRAHVRTPVTNE